jgi:hypothetical protein
MHGVRKIVRQQIDGVLTGLWFHVKARAVETVEETVETVEETVEIAEEIPEAIEILIPTRKFCEGYSLLYLENERLGISQFPPPVLWKKQIQCILKR